MRNKLIVLSLFLLFSAEGNSQEFGTLSGTFRVGGGIYGAAFSFFTPLTVGVVRVLPFTGWGNKDFNDWSSAQHRAFRFLNVGADIWIPNWSITSSNLDVNLERGGNKNWGKQFTYCIGYYLNWKSPFSRFGLFGGVDYEWKNFDLVYPYSELRGGTRFSSVSLNGHNYKDVSVSQNIINSLVPTFGVRYRLIDPMKEVEGFPINVVLEAGISYVINIIYKNDDGYGFDAINNGFRTIIGVALTTNRFGSIHIRWTKDLYNLFNTNYSASNGPLFDNKITNNFSCFCIGWAVFI